MDRLAIEELGLPGVALMENAARAVTAEVLALCGRVERPRVVVLCGGGNNGGDGYAVARQLHNAGVRVRVVALVPVAELKGDARINAEVAAKMKLPILEVREPGGVAAFADWKDASVIVDALLGTGFRGDVREPVASAIRACNAARHAGAGRLKVVAVDLPSGLDCDTGEPADPTVEADVTVTFVAEKVGFGNPKAGAHLGRVVVGDIGAPPELVERARRLST